MQFRTALTLAVLVSVFATSSPAHADPAASTTILVIRHADRPDDGSDVLSGPGVDRAKKLADVFAYAKPDVVFRTRTTRTTQTAQPVIDRFGTPVTEYPAKKGAPFDAEVLREEVLAKYTGKTVLIVGHSDTVASIVKAFAPVDVPKIQQGYDRMYVITAAESTTTARVLAVQYGN
jgi:2,3-bisphosphoglycerate-dependent phosphoglycerate mutase